MSARNTPRSGEWICLVVALIATAVAPNLLGAAFTSINGYAVDWSQMVVPALAVNFPPLLISVLLVGLLRLRWALVAAALLAIGGAALAVWLEPQEPAVRIGGWILVRLLWLAALAVALGGLWLSRRPGSRPVVLFWIALGLDAARSLLNYASNLDTLLEHGMLPLIASSLVLQLACGMVFLGLIYLYLPERLTRRARLAQAADDAVPASFPDTLDPASYWRLVGRWRSAFGIYNYVSVLAVAALVIVWVFAPKPITVLATLCGLVALLLIAISFRRRNLRILLLRPFGERRMTQSLRRFVWRQIGPNGLVYTLSDRDYQPNPIMTLLTWLGGYAALVVAGPILRNSIRVATVADDFSFRRLQRTLMRRLRPSLWSFMNGGEAFNIRSTDEWWQRCIHMLMHSCSVVVVDLSKVKAGTAWELKELHERALLGKCLFVASRAHEGDLQVIAAEHFRDGPPVVHVFDDEGLLAGDDAPAFAASLTTLVETDLSHR